MPSHEYKLKRGICMALDEELQTKFLEVLNLAIKEASKRLTELTNKQVQIEFVDQVDSAWLDENAISVQENSVLMSSNFTEPALGPLALVMKEKDSWIISDLMMGGNGAPEGELDFDEVKQSAFIEALNQAIKAAVSRIDSLNEESKVEISDSELRLLSNRNTDTLTVPEGFEAPLRINLKLVVRGKTESTASIEINSAAVTQLTEAYSELAAEALVNEPADEDQDSGSAAQVEFMDQSGSAAIEEANEEQNLGLLMDVSMGLTVELGRSEMPIKDVLKLSKGSIIELDRLAGEPVDLFVNDKLIARGEVVVIDDNFGLRVTQLAGNLNLAEDMGLLAGAAGE